MNEHSVTTHIRISKRRLTAEQRMAAKALLLDIDSTAILSGGQLILHYGPGRNPFWLELQERQEESSHQSLKLAG